MLCLDEIKHQAVRDLVCSCFSEPLVSDFAAFSGDNAPGKSSIKMTSSRRSWLRALDDNPQPLTSYLEQVQPRRLGLYHEALWHFFLQQDETVELISKNIQIQHQGRTIGEFDVIYQDLLDQRVIHLELAFKFYLRAPKPDDDSLANWLGPEVNDRLDLKLQHMLNHQSQLANHTAGRQTLNAIGIDRVEREISLRGYLLEPQGSANETCLPDMLNPDLQRGLWCTHSQLKPQLGNYQRWTIVPRLNWVSAINPHAGNTYSPDELANQLELHFANNRSCLMICAASGQDTDNQLEQFRIMVTPDNWPRTAEARDNKN